MTILLRALPDVAPAGWLTPGSSARLAASLSAAILAAAVLAAGLRSTGTPERPSARSTERPAPTDRRLPTPVKPEDSQPPRHPPPVMRFFKLSPEEAFLRNAAIPNADGADTAARPFYLDAAEDGGSAAHCLAQAVYYEAGSEGLEGQRAVAQVVLNRVRDPRFPKTVCGVVYEGSTLRTGCQFSFTCDGSLRRPPPSVALQRARTVAEDALAGAVMNAIGHATHYHTVWVMPYWAPSLVKWGRLGSHIFYRWAGGDAQAARGLATIPEVQPIPKHPPVSPPPATDALKASLPLTSPSSIPAVSTVQLPSAAPAAMPPATPGESLTANAPYRTSRSSRRLEDPHFASRDHL